MSGFDSRNVLQRLLFKRMWGWVEAVLIIITVGRDEMPPDVAIRSVILRSNAPTFVTALCLSPGGRVSVSDLLIAAGLAGLVLIAIVVIFELRKTPKQEEEMIEREDKAISKVKDDPNEPARWVP